MPEADSMEKVEDWMLAHLHSTGKLPVKEEDISMSDGNHGDKEQKQSGTPRVQQTLRINTFSGDPDSKGDTTFDLWRFEVKCLIQDEVYPREVIRQAVRKSLKGDAGRVVMRLGPEADLEQILGKLEVVFGVVDVGETLLSEFYAAKQGKMEDVASWGCRIEDLLDKAKQQDLLDGRNTDKMLRERFWTGLHPELKQTSRHKYDTVADFDRLQVEIRKIEKEFQVAEVQVMGVSAKVKDGTVKMAAAANSEKEKETSEVNELKGLVHKLTNEMHNMKLQLQHGGTNQGNAHSRNPQGQQQQGLGRATQAQEYPNQFDQTPRMFDLMPPPQPRCPMTWPQHQGGLPQQQMPQQGWQQGNFRGQQPQQVGTANNLQQQTQAQRGCWRCGGLDHFKRECPQPPACWNCGDMNHLRHQCPHPPLNM